MDNRKVIYIGHTLLTIFLALFFIYSGSCKFIPKKQPAQTAMNAAGEKTKADAKKAELINAIETNTFDTPYAFILTIKSMKATGYLEIVGIFEILAGLLMLMKQTRLIGSLILLPIILNIFLLHLVMDNDVNECIETGALLLTNLTVIGYYKIRLQDLWIETH